MTKDYLYDLNSGADHDDTDAFDVGVLVPLSDYDEQLDEDDNVQDTYDSEGELIDTFDYLERTDPEGYWYEQN